MVSLDPVLVTAMRRVATPKQLEYLEAYLKHGGHRKAAASLGIAHQVLARGIQAMKQKATLQGMGPHFQGGIDAAVPPGLQVKGTSTFFAHGNPTHQWVKTKEEELSLEQLTEHFEEAIEKRPAIKPLSAASCAKRPHLRRPDILPTLFIPEPHLGMLAWANECGENYDLDIAEELLLRSADYLLDAAAPNGTDQMLIMDPGDFFHYSGRKPETEQSKHHLSSDGRWQKTIEAGVRIFTEIVARAAARCKKLDVVRVRGNHDPDWSFWLDVCLRSHFRNSKHIEINTDPTKAKMVEFGQTMMMIDHGDLKKDRDLGEFMANEWPEVWGRTKYRYVWTGHIHHRDAKEHRGYQWESVNSIAAKDDYHADNKYQSLRSMMLVKYHRQWGEVGREIFRPGM